MEDCIVDTLPGLVWTALPDGRIDFLNRGWCEYTGLGFEEARGWGWQTAIHTEDLPELLERWRTILDSGDAGEIEARLRRFDGEYRWFLFRARPLADASGQVVKWCGVNTDIEDRRRAEDTLRAHADRLRLIVDSVPALVTLTTVSGDVEFANRQILKDLGARLEDVKTWQGCDTFHPDDRPAVIAALNRSVETGEPCDVEARRRRADGVYRWFHMRGLPLRDKDGRIVLWCLLHTDVDDRKRAEALLAGQKLLLEMVASGRPLPDVLDGLCRLVDATAEGCSSSVLLLDRTHTRMVQSVGPGLPSSYNDALVGRQVRCATGPCGVAIRENTQVIVSDVAADPRWEGSGWRDLALAHGLKSCWSTPVVSLSGEVLGSAAIFQRQPGSPTPFHRTLIQQFAHIAGIAIERTQNEEDLKRSEAFLAEAQHLSSTGSFLWRTASDEVIWSQETHRIFELDPAVPLTVESISARVHPEDLPAFNAQRERHLRGDDEGDFEFRLQMPDRSVKYLRALTHGGRDENGELVYIGAIQDLTERRLSEDALSKLRSELAHVARVTTLGALTASIAHEVNQPLSGIITNASTCLRMLSDVPPNIDGARETARRTIRDGHRASDVIARLRALFAKQDTRTESVDLNEAAREVIALARSELQRSRTILRAELAEGLPPVAGDRVQLQQVILNLLLNASHAMNDVDDRPRQLAITTERDGADSVRLSVRDAGVGFEPGDVDRLFEAFYTTKTGGMGIGLSVSRSIIESHRGRLWAELNDGPGATFSFSIPHKGEDAERSPPLVAS